MTAIQTLDLSMRYYLHDGPGMDFISVGLTSDSKGHLIVTDKLRRRHVYIEGVSGTGKTSLLKALLWQDIVRGFGFCCLDPVGSLFYDTLDFAGALHLSLSDKARSGRPEVKEYLRRVRDRFIERFDILDFAKDDCGGFFYNPLEREDDLPPEKQLTPNEIAGDMLRCLQRLIGDLNEMRRLQQVLRSACALLCEAGGTLLDVPKLLRMPGERISDFITELDNRAAHNKIRVRAEYARDYLGQFFAHLSAKDKAERYESTLNALGVFLADDRVRRFVSQPKGNLNFSNIVNGGRYLLVHLPRGTDINTQKALGAMIANRIQLTAERRKTKEEIAKDFSLYADEFHFFFGVEWAEAIATVRNKGLNLIVAHQTDTQPPLHTEEGQALLRAFRQNASTHLYFRLGIEDAKNVAWAVFHPTGQRVKRRWTEKALSFQHNSSNAVAQGIADSVGVNVTEAVGKTVSVGRNVQLSYSENEGEARLEARSLGLSLSKSKNYSQTISRSHGLTISQTDSQTFAHSSSTARGDTQAEGESMMHGTSQASSVTHNDASGTHVTFNSGSGGGHQMGEIGVPISMNSSYGHGESSNTSAAHSQMDGVHDAQGKSYSNAISNLFSEARSQANTRSKGRAVNTSTSKGETRGEGTTITASESMTEGLTTIMSYGTSLANGISETVSEMQSRSVGVSVSHQESKVETETKGTSEGESKTEKTELYNIEEDARIASYLLAKSPPRQAFVLTQDKEIEHTEIITHEIPQSFGTVIGEMNYTEDFVLRARPDEVSLQSKSVFERLGFSKARKAVKGKKSEVLD